MTHYPCFRPFFRRKKKTVRFTSCEGAQPGPISFGHPEHQLIIKWIDHSWSTQRAEGLLSEGLLSVQEKLFPWIPCKKLFAIRNKQYHGQLTDLKHKNRLKVAHWMFFPYSPLVRLVECCIAKCMFFFFFFFSHSGRLSHVPVPLPLTCT